MKTFFTVIAFFVFTLGALAQLDTAMVRTYGGERFEEAVDMIQTDDGGYLILGSSGSLEGFNSEVYLLKLTRDLEYDWSKRLGTSGIEKAQAFEETSDGNIIIAGYALEEGSGSSYDILLMKIDPDGELIWSSTYGENDWDFGYEITEHDDGGFLVVGETWSIGSGANDIYLVKFDAEGNYEWQKTYGGFGEDFGTDVIVAQGGDGYLLTGASEVDNQGERFFAQGKIYKVDQVGEVIWERTSFEDSLSVINAISYQGGDYICTGFTIDIEDEVEQMTSQFLTVDGNLYPTVEWGSPGNQSLVDVVHVPAEGTLVYVGTSDTFGNGGLGVYGLRRSDSDIGVLGNRVWGGQEDEVGKGVFADDQDAVLLYGWSDSYGLGSADVYVVKIEDAQMVSEYIIDQQHFIDEEIGLSVSENLSSNLKAYPNPTSGLVSFDLPDEFDGEVAIMNSRGQLIDRVKLLSGLQIDLGSYKSGYYSLQLFNQDGSLLSVERVFKNN